jgi:hypothetical protein
MKHLQHHWRAILATLPLPMLALAASYGVFSFAQLFVPLWVAVIQASAFEATYIGLAVVRVGDAQRRRARAISIGAVVVSVAYNSLAGLFHRQPDLLQGLPVLAECVLAILHGAPLAWVAFLVSDLLLHQETAERLDQALTPQTATSAPDHQQSHEDTASEVIAAEREPARDRTCRYCGEDRLTAHEIMAHGRIRKSTGSCGRAASAD